MNKHDEITEFEEWHYPELSHGGLLEDDEQQPDELGLTSLFEKNSGEEVLHPAQEKESALQAKEAELEEKIAYLNRMGQELSNQFGKIEESLLKNSIKIIQKSIRKLILKEIEADPDIVSKMIEDALEKAQFKEDACVIYVSKSDLKLTENNIFLSHVQFKVNELLNKGDFIIENRFFSLESRLEERIKRLFSLFGDA